MSATAAQFARLMPPATEVESDEPQFESSLHGQQLRLLVASLEWHWRERNDYFLGADLTIYYSRQQLTARSSRSPHFFVARDTEPRPRWSWVIWEEDGRAPDLIIELLADETAEAVKTVKRELYASRLRVPEFFWFHPWTGEWVGFELRGRSYEELPPDERGLRWSRVLDLYLGVHNQQLRYFSRDGLLIPTPEEELTRLTAKREAERADQQSQRVTRLAAKLRELGIDPDLI